MELNNQCGDSDTAKEIYTEIVSGDNRTEQGSIYDTLQHGTGELADKITPSAKKCTRCTLVNSILVGLLIIAVSVSLYMSINVSKASNSKVNVVWSDWKQWGKCSVTCGVGLQSRVRSCTNPTPTNAGEHYIGQKFDVKLCYNDICLYEDCFAIKKRRGRLPSGIYDVRLWNTSRVIPVYCDFDTDKGGWTVFQYRFNGNVDFYRNFSDYERGFGSLDGEFWLGLKHIYEMVSRHKTELRLDLTAANGRVMHETFQNFRLSNGPYYTLSMDIGVSNANESKGLPNHVGQAFTTYDHDQDAYLDNCALLRRGGWWYKNCGHANLNGKYAKPGILSMGKFAHDGMFYYSFRGPESLKTSKMMFRRV